MSGEYVLMLVIYLPLILMVHLLMYNVQLISGRNYYYGVYVKEIELKEEDKKDIDKRFKRKTNLLFLVISLLVIVNMFIIKIYPEIAITLLLLIYVLVEYVFLRNAYVEVKNIKDDIITSQNIEIQQEKRKVFIDTEFLNQKYKLQTKFKKLFMINILISLISLIYLVINYNNLPEQIISHWGIDGMPDGYSQKNILSVFFPSFMDISVVILLAVMTITTLGVRINLDASDIEKNRKKAIEYLNKIGYSFFLLTLSIQLITSTMPISIVNESKMSSGLMAISLFGTIFLAFPSMYYYTKLMALKSRDKSIRTINDEDDKWLYGMIYYNQEDPSFLVEKRFGAGWTFNMANKKAQISMILLGIWIIVMMVLPFFID